MKKYIFSLITLLAPLAAWAQTAYDAEIMTTSDLNGTARYVGMGGALGALGADISTMGSNPAGTALLRSSNFSFTAGGVFTGLIHLKGWLLKVNTANLSPFFWA